MGYIHLYIPISSGLTLLVKLAGLIAQLIAAIFAVYSSTPPELCMVSGVLAFLFGAMEGGASLLWKRFL
jgi:hypothetical protein